VPQQPELFTAHGIPCSLSPFLQEYRIEELDPEHARDTLIERALRYGNRAELRWLFRRFGEPAIADWVRRWRRLGLPRVHLAFWRTVLNISGFFSYGYPLLQTSDDAEGVPLAGTVDLGLMKLDAVATRATRKDFCDLYILAQTTPLRQLLDAAPRKYPAHRDFEARVVRYLTYFERADQEAPVSLLRDVPWEEIKAFFRQQAALLARGWWQ